MDDQNRRSLVYAGNIWYNIVNLNEVSIKSLLVMYSCETSSNTVVPYCSVVKRKLIKSTESFGNNFQM